MSEPLADVDLVHEQVVVNGVRLHVVTAGPPGGDPVLLLHGFPDFWYTWRFQVPALVEAGHRVVVPDLRGYNRSEKPPGVDSYDVTELVGDVAGLAETYGDGSAHVVGHDWGGTVAWTVGIRRPAVVDRLVVLNAPHPAAFARDLDLAQVRRSWYALLFQVPWLPEWLLTARNCRPVADLFREAPSNPEALEEGAIARHRAAFCRPGVARAAVNYYRAYLRRTVGPMLKASLPGLRRLSDPPGDTEIPVPTLVLWGEEDPALGVSLSEGLGEWVPDIRVERFPGASHWVHWDRPGRVGEELTRFL